MYLFLTSSPCNDDVPSGVDLPCIWHEANGFTKELLRLLNPGMKCVVIAADPDAYALNDEMTDTFGKCFAYCGLTPSSCVMLDSRTMDRAQELISESDAVILGGGYVPTQNKYFSQLGLRDILRGYNGVVIGISAGSMNCNHTVYAMPEEPEDLTDPDYSLFLPGLGLTEIMIIPHLNRLRYQRLNGLRLIDDIAFRDSVKRTFYAIPDGSYVYQESGRRPEIRGEAYRIHDYVMERICDHEQVRIL